VCGTARTAIASAVQTRVSVRQTRPAVTVSLTKSKRRLCSGELVAGTRAQVIVTLTGDETAVLTQKASEMASVTAAAGRGPSEPRTVRRRAPDHRDTRAPRSRCAA
jgi:hypothetical protein